MTEKAKTIASGKNFGFAKDQLRFSFLPKYKIKFIEENSDGKLVPIYDSFYLSESPRALKSSIQAMVTNGLGYGPIRSEEERRGRKTRTDLVRHLGEMEQRNFILDKYIMENYLSEAVKDLHFAEKNFFSLLEDSTEIIKDQEKRIDFYEKCQTETLELLKLTQFHLKERRKELESMGSFISKDQDSSRRKKQGIYHWFYSD